MSKVLVGGDVARAAPAPTAGSMARTASVPLLALALAIGGVAIIDLLLVWFPMRFGTQEWEFGVASRTFDSVGGVTMGLVFLTLAGILRGWVTGMRVLALMFGTMLLVLLMWAAVFGLNIPVALQAVPEASQGVLRTSIVRTLCFVVVNVVVYGWLGWFTWRRAGAAFGGEKA